MILNESQQQQKTAMVNLLVPTRQIELNKKKGSIRFLFFYY